MQTLSFSWGELENINDIRQQRLDGTGEVTDWALSNSNELISVLAEYIEVFKFFVLVAAILPVGGAREPIIGALDRKT